MTDTLKSVVEDELQKAYERGVQDGKKQERALWELSRIGQEIEHVHAVNISQERVHKMDKNVHEPVAWVYPEGLEAFKNGKCWTAYGTHQNEQMSPLYENSPKIEQEPYGWVTFNAYGEEDDVWYENPEGQLLEGWTYKPLYDTTPPKKEWRGLTYADLYFWGGELGLGELGKGVLRAVDAHLREKNT